VIDLVYLRDLMPNLDEDDPAAVQAALQDARLVPKVREMSALGEFYMGMCSCHVFVALRENARHGALCVRYRQKAFCHDAVAPTVRLCPKCRYLHLVESFILCIVAAM
jgi:hypothetical protein